MPRWLYSAACHWQSSSEPSVCRGLGSCTDDEYPTSGEVLAADLAHRLGTEGEGLSREFRDCLREAICVLT